MCRALTANGSTTLAGQLTDRVWRWLWRQISLAIRLPHPIRRADELTELGPALARTLESATDAIAMVDELCATDDRANPLLLATLRAHEPPASALVKALARESWERTVRGLARPERLDDDWSISWSGCGCADCERFADFLRSGPNGARTGRWHRLDASTSTLRSTTPACPSRT